jgi:general secretion pathway protein D
MIKKVFVYLLVLPFLTSCFASNQIKMADQRVQEEKWDEAFEVYLEEAKKHPDDQTLKVKLYQVRLKAGGLHLLKGKELERAGNIDEAITEFRKALVFDPGKSEYQTALIRATRLKESEDHYQSGQKLIKAGNLEGAAEELEKAFALNPENETVKESLVRLNVSKEMVKQEGTDLSLKSSQPITLKFHNARLKEVFELLSKTAGINILFDKDVRDDNVTIFVKDATFKETLNLILATNSLFMKKISEDTILIIPKTKQKVDQYQDLMIRIFYLSNTKAKPIGDLLRTMLEIRRIQINEELNSITIRETPEKIKLAEKIIEANDRKIGEVMLEFEILEVQSTDALRYGFTLDNYRIGALMGGNTAVGSNATQFTPGIIDMATLKNLNDQVFQFIVPKLFVDFLKTESNAKTLANPRIRVLDGKAAKINIGDRVPILLSSTTGVVSPGSAVIPTTATQTEFKDVGIKVTAEPLIHLNNDITIKLGLEVSSLGDQVDLGGGIKQFKFGQRTADTFLNLRDGETAVIGGMIRDEDRKAESKIPGLGDIPLLGIFFSGKDKGKSKADILLTITPHLIHGLETPSKDLQSFWSGTEESYSTKPLFAEFPTVGDVRRGAGETPVSPPTPGTPPLPPLPVLPRGSQAVPPPDESGGEASLQVVPPAGQVFEGQETSIDLFADSVNDLSEIDLTLNYNPAVLDLKKAVEGGFMKSDGAQTSFVTSVNALTGTINVHLLRVGKGEGISGGGAIATLTFLGKRKGESFVSIKDGRLLSSAKGLLPVRLNSGMIKVQ